MPITLTLYYRNDCHLCEEMTAEIYRLHGNQLQLRLIDVDTDEDLKERYALKVPVLADGSKIICYGKIDHAALKHYLEHA